MTHTAAAAAAADRATSPAQDLATRWRAALDAAEEYSTRSTTAASAVGLDSRAAEGAQRRAQLMNEDSDAGAHQTQPTVPLFSSTEPPLPAPAWSLNALLACARIGDVALGGGLHPVVEALLPPWLREDAHLICQGVRPVGPELTRRVRRVAPHLPASEVRSLVRQAALAELDRGPGSDFVRLVVEHALDRLEQIIEEHTDPQRAARRRLNALALNSPTPIVGVHENDCRPTKQPGGNK